MISRLAVDRILGQTPCVCGDTETWHPSCYAGKSEEQIDKEYTRAYRLARRKINDDAADAARAALVLAWKSHHD